MTITETTTTTPVFDFDSHGERGQLLRAELLAAREELASAEADREAAETAVELLDVLSDTDNKITKTRLAAERAEARVNRAGAALRGAERKAAKFNIDARLAEAMRPMCVALTGNHPGIGIYALPAEPDWSALPVPSLVVIQRSAAVPTPLTPGSLSTASADRDNAVVLVYVHDRIHRDLLADREGILTAAARNGVTLRSTDRLGAAEGVAVNHIRPVTRELGGETFVTEVPLHVSIYPAVPVFAEDEFDPSRFWTLVEHRGRQRGLGKVLDPAVRVRHEEGQRVATLSARIRVLEPSEVTTASRDLLGWKGEAYPAVGRITGARVEDRSGDTLAVEFVAISLPE